MPRPVLFWDYVLNHGPTNRFGIEGSVAAGFRPGEGFAHVGMKLLSFLVHHHEGLVIEGSAGQHYKPDLVRLDDEGRPVQWVDCGSTSIKKLCEIVRRNPGCPIDIVKKAPSELRLYRLQAERRVPDGRVRYQAYDRGFLDELGRVSVARHRVTATLDDDGARLFFSLDDRAPWETHLHWMRPTPWAAGKAG